jgi:hypothetical protein
MPRTSLGILEDSSRTYLGLIVDTRLASIQYLTVGLDALTVKVYSTKPGITRKHFVSNRIEKLYV